MLQKEIGGQTEIFINRILSKFEAECLTKGLNLKKKSVVIVHIFSLFLCRLIYF